MPPKSSKSKSKTKTAQKNLMKSMVTSSYADKYAKAPFLTYMNANDQKRAKEFAQSKRTKPFSRSFSKKNFNAFKRFQRNIRAKYPKLVNHNLKNYMEQQQKMIKLSSFLLQHMQQKEKKLQEKLKTNSFNKARFLSGNVQERYKMLGLKKPVHPKKL